MKKRILPVFAVFLCYLASAQTPTNALNSTGNAGVGTTTPTEKLQIVGGNILLDQGYKIMSGRIRFQSTTGPEISQTRGFLGQNIYWDATTNTWVSVLGTTSDFGMVRLENAGLLGFYTAPNTSTAYSLTNDAMLAYRRMYITNTGMLTINSRYFRSFNSDLTADFTSTSKQFVVFGANATGLTPDASSNAGALYGLKLNIQNSSPSNTALETKTVVYGLVSEDPTAGYSRAVGAAIYTSDLDQTAAERLRISSTGNVGIGTTAPTQKLHVNGNLLATGQVFIGTVNPSILTNYALAVNGSALFTKAVVKNYSTWPDYVFGPGYRLPSLDSVETFIKINQHLPGVLSAEEIDKNGLDLGNNQAALLKKIEELTLYIIEQEKQLKDQKTDIQELKTTLVKQQQIVELLLASKKE